ncbi:unnamed protein product [Acanthoscelides obtectus]|uniref:Uncharacterized protein n=1 Tax=Acanthoscelides obtectus TaxID=200917 RepID=A0A9P0JJZ0_ACAOB|nr:unnamed protein product [Acanthoscelides obtectus]CAK1639934.1 hypothetical protein AOBTE_LOCUS11461 [Acanthoscelides obtectus]
MERGICFSSVVFKNLRSIPHHVRVMCNYARSQKN